MLRPAKIFASFHQLRHYIHNRVSELVHPIAKVASPAIQWKPPPSPNIHLTSQEHQKLLSTLQQQFPIVKIFSTPFHRPCPVSFARPISRPPLHHQLRTIVYSSSSSSGHSGTPVTFSCGFPRTATVGYARVPFAARQFSTGKPSSMAFQGPTQANTVFSHVSSRIFSPIGAKLGPARESSPSRKPAKEHQKEPLEAYNRLTRHEIKGISDLVFSPTQKSPGLVRREAVSRIRHTPNTPYDYIHQDLTVQSTGLAKRLLHPRQCQRSKEPPDPRHVFRGTDPPDHSVYLSISLDSLFVDWEVEPLSVSIKAIASLCSHYQHLLSLLHHLHRHAEFKSQLQGSELKLYFPPELFGPFAPVNSVRHWLRSIDVDPDNACFVIKQPEPKEVLYRHETMGPEYFRGIQQFLDHVDDLIETGPAFGSSFGQH
ncbi:hypothetical protein CLU79DRAFT_766736 [Phycomyces nitens]|nr:hypothetical protein CLU79DRAFT_766736 [Phycomyces nitens]